jgi:hypothetical protein
VDQYPFSNPIISLQCWLVARTFRSSIYPKLSSSYPSTKIRCELTRTCCSEWPPPPHYSRSSWIQCCKVSPMSFVTLMISWLQVAPPQQSRGSVWTPAAVRIQIETKQVHVPTRISGIFRPQDWREGLHALSEKVEAVASAPEPRNIQELRSFLGLLNYYGKFLPNRSTLIRPLNALLQQDKRWTWSSECSEAFQEAKRALSSACVLVHCDPSLPITLAGDASAYGIGAVISHVLHDGSEKPIAFASRSLANVTTHSLRKKLSVSFLVSRNFTNYGRKFRLVTDHKPLLAILGPKKGIPSLAAAHLQRWAVLLSAYQYEIYYKRTDEHAKADGLSRLPLPSDTDKNISTKTTSVSNITDWGITNHFLRNCQGNQNWHSAQ